MVLTLDANVTTLVTMMGAVIAWIALIATFSDIAHSMLSRLDNALFTAATAEPGVTVGALKYKAAWARRLIVCYVISGAIFMPISFTALLVHWRRRRRQ